MTLEKQINAQLQQIAEADETTQVEEAISQLKEMGLKQQLSEDSLSRLTPAIGNCLLMFLDDMKAPERFRHWIATYFGQVQIQYANPEQQPKFLYYPGLEEKPWFSAEECGIDDEINALSTDAATELRQFIDANPPEYDPYVTQDMNDEQWDSLVQNANWGTFPLVLGNGQSKVLADLPASRLLIDRLPLAALPPMAPEVFISRLNPGVELPAHYGLSNVKLTAHFPIKLPKSDKLSITVGGVTKQWQDDQWLVFDDSFLHSAANHSDEERLVLICDFWNPQLQAEERTHLQRAITVISKANLLFSSWR